MMKRSFLFFLLNYFISYGSIIGSDSVTIQIEDLSYQGMKCENCDKHVVLECEQSAKIFESIGEDVLTTELLPILLEDGLKIELIVELWGSDTAISENISSQERRKIVLETGKCILRHNESILLSENTSKEVRFEDIGFRVLYPVLKFRVLPEFPEVVDEDGNHIKGLVHLALSVKEDGSVGNIRVGESADKRLIEPAKEAMRKAIYIPPTMDGKPKPTTHLYTATFDK